ncbi:hypothetical protein BZA05DRAFT_466641 [Tricharina praecox]|uniref:uncharacterized protein n=1 Tax=Tricharina praecox TaxID=43433 RepID=UPI0022202EAF|nr:uncharacterized protein BZA05DRAFT_466641 [Tricharina praecox]KAI5854554.1 hypothetical protein BZA05DRAFT_466641 [Tricharina praecox]
MARTITSTSTSTSTSSAPLLTLPNELFLTIADHLSTPTLSSFAQASPRLYHLLNSRLYRTSCSQRAFLAHLLRDQPLSHFLQRGLPATRMHHLPVGPTPGLATSPGAPAPLLAVAVWHDAFAAVQALLKAGADATAYPVLLLAVGLGKGSGRMVKLLLENGAEKEVEDRYGRTPLELAEAWRDTHVVELLRECEV